MNKLFYPALFQEAEEGGWGVSCEVIPECEMAVEALGLSLSSMEDEKAEIPTASRPQDIQTEVGSFLVVIEFDMAEYRRRHCSRAVKKTLSIPEWLNDVAIKQNINFSQVLQEALMERVGVR